MATRKLFDERETLGELADGSESAFVQVFDEYSPRVYSVALKFLDSKELAEEVVQDIFMDIWLRREKMAEVLNFGAYLHGMVRKQVYDAYRQKSAFTEIVKELSLRARSENVIERMMQENEYENLLQKALERLPDRQREIFRLAREEGLSHEEIARRLNLSRLSVKSHMKRILRYLRTLLEPVLKTETFLWLFILFN
ncbi:MAG: hypothetical protein ABS46_12690 [Cytophagaceae bacterium SCN 52-12]|nr:MAG: hypothetical protein ABS46_12690 [Cytophagaceae bacterium SCN 52-12]